MDLISIIALIGFGIFVATILIIVNVQQKRDVTAAAARLDRQADTMARHAAHATATGRHRAAWRLNERAEMLHARATLLRTYPTSKQLPAT